MADGRSPERGVAGVLRAGTRTELRAGTGTSRGPSPDGAAMTAPSVSVVIPSRNDAGPLARCLDALRRQTLPPLEVVVVDNASDDGTAAAAASYGARVVHEPRVGIPPAAAAGYDASRGDSIARLDADSIPPPEWLEGMVAALLEDPRTAAVTGNGTFYDRPGRRGALAMRLYLGGYYRLGYLAAANHMVWGSNFAMRRSAWRGARDRVHRLEREIHDDMDLALALGPDAAIRRVPLAVGVSARSLRGRRQTLRRWRRAFRTLRLGWRDAPPWVRWAERARRPAPPAGPATG